MHNPSMTAEELDRLLNQLCIAWDQAQTDTLGAPTFLETLRQLSIYQRWLETCWTNHVRSSELADPYPMG